MSVTFDPVTGHLRLDAEAFDVLVEHAERPAQQPTRPPAGGRSTPGDALARLVAGGVLVDGRPHPRLRETLTGVTSSRGSVQVVVGDDEGVRLHHAWLGATAVAVLTDRGDHTFDLGPSHATELPGTLAAWVTLAPRPELAAATVTVPDVLLEELASHRRGLRRAAARALADALGPWPAARGRVHSGRWRLATVDVALATGEQTLAQHLAWLDTGAGLLRAEAVERDVRLTPTTSTELRRDLATVVATGG